MYVYRGAHFVLYHIFHSRFFLEEDALDQNGKLTREKHKAVNKIGHGKSVADRTPLIELILN